MADVVVSSSTAETLYDTDLRHPLFIQPTGADPTIYYTGSDWRNLVQQMLPGNGILHTGDFTLTASGTGRTVNVAAGAAVVQTQGGTDRGSYLVISSGQIQVTLPANASGSTMTYRFGVEVRDKLYSGTKYDATIIAVESTPGGTPTTAAALRAAGRHFVELGVVTVTNGLATIVSGNITNGPEISTNGLATSWTNLSLTGTSITGTIQYRRDANSNVWLRGNLVYSGAALTSAALTGALPSGFTPPATRVLPISVDSGPGTPYQYTLMITSAGALSIIGAASGNIGNGSNKIYFDNVVFSTLA